MSSTLETYTEKNNYKGLLSYQQNMKTFMFLTTLLASSAQAVIVSVNLALDLDLDYTTTANIPDGFSAQADAPGSDTSFTFTYDLSSLSIGLGAMELTVVTQQNNVKSDQYGLGNVESAIISWRPGSNFDFVVKLITENVDVTESYLVDLTGAAIRMENINNVATIADQIVTSGNVGNPFPTVYEFSLDEFPLDYSGTSETEFSALKGVGGGVGGNENAQLGQLTFVIIPYCADVSDGTCTACTTPAASGCTAVTCDGNRFDTNTDATDGCEAGCATVNDGTCTACTTPAASGCTAVTCDGNRFDTNTDATDGCEAGCATVTDGTCTACSSVLASGCTAVTCASGKIDTNGDATDGCEDSCATVTDGTCTACTTPAASGCTAITCDGNRFDTNTDATDGCEAGCATVNDGTCTACTTPAASGCTAVTCDGNRFDTNTDATDGCEEGCPLCENLDEKFDCTEQNAIANTVCTACEEGYYQSEISHMKPSCMEICEAGQQQSASNQLVCEVCPLGRFSDGVNIPCKHCIAGKLYINSSTVCPDCPIGTYQDDFDTGETACKTCDAGQVAPNIFGSSSDSYDPSVTFNDQGLPIDDGGNDITTPPGTFLGCEDCLSETYQELPEADVFVCKTCESGGIFISNSLPCVSCPPGRIIDTDDASCNDCPIGFYQDQSNQQICLECDVTEASLSKGYGFSDELGLTQCKACSTTCPVGESEDSACQSDQDFQCYCPPGKKTSGGTCNDCQIGFYQDQRNQLFCLECDVTDATSDGGFSDELGLTQCKACSTTCPVGESEDSACQSDQDLQCIGCEEGQYRSIIPVNGEFPCLYCEAGTEMVDWDNPGTSCTDCLAGKYQPSDIQSNAVCVDCLAGFTGGTGRSEQCTERTTCVGEAITCTSTEAVPFQECGTPEALCTESTCCRQPCDIDTAATSTIPCQCGIDSSELCELGEYCTTRTSLADRTNAFCSKGDHTALPFPHEPDCKPLALVGGEMVPDTEATSTCQCWQGEVAPFTIGYDSVTCTSCSSQCTSAASCNSRYGHCVLPDYCTSFNGVGELDVQTGCLCEFPASYNDQYEGNTAHTCVSKYCRAKLSDDDKCGATAISGCKNKLGLYPNVFPTNEGGLLCGCGLSGLCDDTVPYCVGSISLCTASPGTSCENINGNFINPSPCACSALDIDGNAIGTPDGCDANMYCDAGVCSNAMCPTSGLCTNNHIIGPEETFYFEGYTPDAKCITEDCDENADIVSCCERCYEWNEEAARCGIPCPEFFDCESVPALPNYVRPPGNYRYDTAGLEIWEIERFNTGKFDDVCSDGCSETNPQNVETCCLRADSCDEHHQNSLCVNTDNFADPFAIGSWDGSKICEGHQCRPEECCDFIICTCENGTPAFPPQCVNNTNVCQEVCDEGYFKINATHCYLGTVCAADEYMYQIPNLVFDTRCKLLNVCIDDVEYISADETDASVNGTGTNRNCSLITLCDYDYQFQEENYTLYTDSICTNVTLCNTSTHFELTPATETTDRVCTELSPPCDFPAGEYIAQANNMTHDRICLNIDFADCATTEYMFQDYSETQNRICEPLTLCDATEYISVNATIDSDLTCSNLTECDFTQQYIRILATDYTDRTCSTLRECSGFEFISVNETTTSNRVCTPLSKCAAIEYAAPQNTTYFDRVCSTCEADGLTADGETCLGCMTEGNCDYNQFALVQDDASCFAEQCTTYSILGMTFTNASGTFDMADIVLINDDWVRFDVIDGVEPDITVTGDVVKVYNDLNELLYLYFQVPVSVDDFNATLNDTNFLLRQNCVVTILLEDKCVSDPLVDLCDGNYTRPGQQAIWWEIQYPPLEGGQACPGSGDPIDPYYVDCVNYDCDRDCNETLPSHLEQLS